MSKNDLSKEDEKFVNPFASNDGDLKKFSDELLGMKGEIVEIFLGEKYQSLSYSDGDVDENSVIYAKVIDVLDRFVKVHCYYIDPITKDIKDDNIVYINTFQIRALTVCNGNGSIDDIFLSSRASKKVRKAILSSGK
jgi:hypothetical protein